MIEVIIAVVGRGTVGAFITSMFNYKTKKGDDTKDGFQSVIDFLKEDNTRLRDDNVELKMNIELLTERIKIMERKIIEYEAKFIVLTQGGIAKNKPSL